MVVYLNSKFGWQTCIFEFKIQNLTSKLLQLKKDDISF